MEENLCRCNATPTAGSSKDKVVEAEDEEYFPPRVATPPAVPSGVLVPVEAVVESPRRVISDEPLVDRAESRVDCPAENEVPIPLVSSVSASTPDEVMN